MIPPHLAARLASRGGGSIDPARIVTAPPAADPSFLTTFREQISHADPAQLNELEELLAKQTALLSPYDQRMCLQALKPLRDKHLQASQTRAFKFSVEAAAPLPPTPQVDPTPIATTVITPPLEPRSALVLTPSPDGNLVLENLTDKDILLPFATQSLHLINLSRCTIFAGPVNGSLLVRGISHCQVQAAARQVRVHSSAHCIFGLRTSSGPIIESSAHLTFGPLTFSYPTLDQDLQDSPGLQTDQGQWAQVKDFGWLKSTPSPNFTIVS